MRRISPVLVLLLGSVVGVASSCDGGDEGIGNKANEDKEDGGNDDSDDGDTSESSGGNAATSAATSAASSAGSSSAATSASSTADTSSDNTPLGTVVGVGCDADDDCAAPTTCIRKGDAFDGALPGTGVCSMPCEVDDDCQAVDGFAYCDYVGVATDEALANTPEGEVPEGIGMICLQACLYGQPDTTKCGGLTTFTCAPWDDVVRADETGQVEFMIGGCVPLCHADSDCGDSERCDPAWGLCVEVAAEGKAFGESCNLDAAESECASGYCLGISDDLDVGVCSGACNFHPDTTVCGGEIGTTAKAGCVGNMFTPIESNIGDLGQCVPLCDADDDCATGLACDLSDPETTLQYYGRSGFCWPTEESIAEAVGNMQPDEPSDAGVEETTADASASSGDGG